MTEHDAITRALDVCRGFHKHYPGDEIDLTNARAQLDALLAENERLREALQKLVARVNDVFSPEKDAQLRELDAIIVALNQMAYSAQSGPMGDIAARLRRVRRELAGEV